MANPSILERTGTLLNKCYEQLDKRTAPANGIEAEFRLASLNKIMSTVHLSGIFTRLLVDAGVIEAQRTGNLNFQKYLWIERKPDAEMAAKLHADYVNYERSRSSKNKTKNTSPTMDNRTINYNPELVKKTFGFLEELYKALDRVTYRKPNSREKLRRYGLSGHYMVALKDLKITEQIGARAGVQAIWQGAKPTMEMAELVYSHVKTSNTKKKTEERSKTKPLNKKFKALVIRKQQNPGTIFIALSAAWVATRHVTPFTPEPFLKKYELPDDFFTHVAALGYCEEIKNGWRWLKEPDMDLCEVLYTEVFKGRKSLAGEAQASILKAITEIKRRSTTSKVIEATQVHEIFHQANVGNQYHARIRQAFLQRIGLKMAERLGHKTSKSHFASFYTFVAEMPPANMEGAVAIYDNTLTQAVTEQQPSETEITPGQQTPLNNSFITSMLEQINQVISVLPVTGYQVKKSKIIIYINN